MFKNIVRFYLFQQTFNKNYSSLEEFYKRFTIFNDNINANIFEQIEANRSRGKLISLFIIYVFIK